MQTETLYLLFLGGLVLPGMVAFWACLFAPVWRAGRMVKASHEANWVEAFERMRCSGLSLSTKVALASRAVDTALAVRQPGQVGLVQAELASAKWER